jgi:hypothetical protein
MQFDFVYYIVQELFQGFKSCTFFHKVITIFQWIHHIELLNLIYRVDDRLL